MTHEVEVVGQRTLAEVELLQVIGKGWLRLARIGTEAEFAHIGIEEVANCQGQVQVLSAVSPQGEIESRIAVQAGT